MNTSSGGGTLTQTTPTWLMAFAGIPFGLLDDCNFHDWIDRRDFPAEALEAE